jgi:hypothetical protein
MSSKNEIALNWKIALNFLPGKSDSTTPNEPRLPKGLYTPEGVSTPTVACYR